MRPDRGGVDSHNLNEVYIKTVIEEYFPERTHSNVAPFTVEKLEHWISIQRWLVQDIQEVRLYFISPFIDIKIRDRYPFWPIFALCLSLVLSFSFSFSFSFFLSFSYSLILILSITSDDKGGIIVTCWRWRWRKRSRRRL